MRNHRAWDATRGSDNCGAPRQGKRQRSRNKDRIRPMLVYFEAEKDLAAVISLQPHASEVLNRRPPVSLPIIRTLSAVWGLPPDTLVREYNLATIG